MTPRWEYRLEIMDMPAGDALAAARAAAVAGLDTLGAEGWEAVGFTPWKASTHGLRVETNAYVVLLKRQLAT